MKKFIIIVAVCIISGGAFSQDKMNKKMDNKTDKMVKKMDNKTDKMAKKVDSAGKTTQIKTHKATKP